MMYVYKATVISVYDGDTITVDIDLGFNVFLRKIKMRLADINAPEIRGDNKEAGIAARDWLRSMILDREVVIRTRTAGRKTGKYGRWIVEVFIDDADGYTVNSHMVQQGLAVRQEY